MRHRNTWSDVARDYIDLGYRELRSTFPPEVTDDEIMKKVSRDYYPFGERANWPYQAWLKQIKLYKEALSRKLPLYQETNEDAVLPLFDKEDE